MVKRKDIVQTWQARSFSCSPWIRGPHFQTIGGKFCRPRLRQMPDPEILTTPDKDFLVLDWMPETTPDTPLVIVLHGLEGHTRRRYVTQAFSSLQSVGLQSVGLNFRGCSGSPNLSSKAYHSGETEDLLFITRVLRSRFPGRPLMALGFSLGGNVLLKFLGETGDEYLDAAAVVSVPYDLSAGADSLESDVMARIYTMYFMRSLIQKMRAKQQILSASIDFESLSENLSIRDFDEMVTSKLHGFTNAADYYERSSSSQYISSITTPSLLIHSEDDPFLPPSKVPKLEIKRNQNLRLLLTQKGGHVGFIEGSHPGNFVFWAEEQASRFLKHCFDQGRR